MSMFGYHPYGYGYRRPLMYDPFLSVTPVLDLLDEFMDVDNSFTNNNRRTGKQGQQQQLTAGKPSTETDSKYVNDDNTSLSTQDSGTRSHALGYYGWPNDLSSSLSNIPRPAIQHLSVNSDDKNYIVSAAMAGCAKEDIQLELHDRVLSITAKVKTHTKKDNTNTNDASNSQTQQGTSASAAVAAGKSAPVTDTKSSIEQSTYASMTRSIRLGRDADSDPAHIQAKYEHGLLTVTVPKLQDVKKGKAIPIA